MSAGSSLALVLGIAVLAFALRATLIVVLSEVGIPARVERALSYVGPAALASLAVNFAFGGEGGPHIGLPEVLALSAALAMTLWKRNLIFALAAAMPVLWLATAMT